MAKNLSFQNRFSGGLKTEFTELNFPENAATDTSNCVFNLIGDALRRPGIDLESNAVTNTQTPSATSTFRWYNAGGDGETQVVVVQTGDTLNFYQSTNSTVAAPLSTTLLASTISLTGYTAVGQSGDPGTIECQYASGNGYLFVYNSYCDPFYCTFNAGVIQSNVIDVQIRDFNGYYPEPGNPPINVRPSSLSIEHQYNLENQGWTATPSWIASGTGTSEFNINNNTYVSLDTGTIAFTVASGITGISNGAVVSVSWNAVAYLNQRTGTLYYYPSGAASGTVSSYSGTTLTLIISSSTNYNTAAPGTLTGISSGAYTITPGVGNNTIATFKTDVGVYPSDADIWYTFKDSSNLYNPSTTYASVGTPSTPAPRGYFILNAFNQNQTGASNITGLTNLSTGSRPSTGAWFQGRVFYTGVNGSQAASGDQNFYTWSENIYFSQIIQANATTTFGYCYQTNDPTDENLFDLLPTDGGVITIQGCGNIFKLFPIQNGMLVFAQNGIWFITGSTGIGFAATDYTITKISAIQSISNTSFIDVMGLPYFWNEEGIYRVAPAQNQGLQVEPLTIGTILSFYNEIPRDSKQYARGDYDPIGYVVKWAYRSTQETGLTNRYQYDSALNFNIFNKAFYPYLVSFSNSTPDIAGLFYLNYTNSVTAPDPGFKYLTVNSTNGYSFAEEADTTNWVDWFSLGGVSYDSYFVTGYNLHGKTIFKFQPTYVNMYSRNPSSYLIQSIWDFASSPTTGRYSTEQLVLNPKNITYASGISSPDVSDYNAFRNRIKLRGHGESLQIRVSSYTDNNNVSYPFDIIGWSIMENIDAGV
jgi:hypothetical protein